MAVFLTDIEIAALTLERKSMPAGYRQRITLRRRRGHRRRNLEVEGEQGSRFRIIIRQSVANPFDFSVGLAYHVPQTNTLFRLVRYNGRHGKHTNIIEKTSFFDYHIHRATERYQRSGFREDSFAEPTTQFSDLHAAINCMLADCGFDLPPNVQMPLL